MCYIYDVTVNSTAIHRKPTVHIEKTVSANGAIAAFDRQFVAESDIDGICPPRPNIFSGISNLGRIFVPE